MARFLFHIRDADGLMLDSESIELADLPTARKEAVLSLRELLAEDFRLGSTPIERVIEIADQSGRVVATIRYEDAMIPPPETSP